MHSLVVPETPPAKSITWEEVQAKLEMIQLAEPEYDPDKIIVAGVYFRKFDETWAPEINRAEALPLTYLNKILQSFKNLVERREKEARFAAKCAAEVAAMNMSLFPELDLVKPKLKIKRTVTTRPVPATERSETCPL